MDKGGGSAPCGGWKASASRQFGIAYVCFRPIAAMSGHSAFDPKRTLRQLAESMARRRTENDLMPHSLLSRRICCSVNCPAKELFSGALGTQLGVHQQRIKRSAILVQTARDYTAYRGKICDVGRRIRCEEH